MKSINNQIEKSNRRFNVNQREDFIAFVKENDPKLYQAAVEKGWLNSILDDLGFKRQHQPLDTISTK